MRLQRVLLLLCAAGLSSVAGPAWGCVPRSAGEVNPTELDLAYRSAPFDPGIVKRRAERLERQCRHAEAYEMWERLLLLRPEEPEVLQRMAFNRVPVSADRAEQLFRQYSLRPGISLTSDAYCASAERFVRVLDTHGHYDVSRGYLEWLSRRSGRASCDVIRRQRRGVVATVNPLPMDIAEASEIGEAWFGFAWLLLSPLLIGLVGLRANRPVEERWTLPRLQQERPDVAQVVGLECSWLYHDVLRHGLGGLHATADALEVGDEEAWPWLRKRLEGDEGVLPQLRRFTTGLNMVIARELPHLDARGEFPTLEAVESVRRELSLQLQTVNMDLVSRASALRSVAIGLEETVCPVLVECARQGEVTDLSAAWIREVWHRLLRERVSPQRGLDLHVDIPYEAVRVRIPQRDAMVALSNLLRNAMDASVRCGAETVVVRVRCAVCPVTGQPRVHLGVGDAVPGGWEPVCRTVRDAKRGLGLVDAVVSRASGVVRFSVGSGGWKWATVDLGGEP